MRLQLDDVSLWFDTIGSALHIENDRVVEQPTIVALHGGPGIDHTSVRPSVTPLSGYAQVVILDQRGHGRSDRSTPDTWNTTSWADDIARFCEALSIEAPILFGTSFGGEVALNVAARYPDLASGLILASSAGGLRDDAASIEALRRLGGDAVAEVARRDVEEPSPEAFAEWLEVCLPFYSRRPGAKEFSDEFRARAIHSEEVTLHVMKNGSGQPDPTSLAAEVRCPTLVVCGALDVVVPTELINRLVDGFDSSLATLELVPNASHWIFRDNPTHAYEAIQSFVTEIVSRQSNE